MINLIKNEIIKITHKKAFYIILIIVTLFIILNNVLYKVGSANNNDSYYGDYIEPPDKSKMAAKLALLDPNKASDIDEYIGYKTNLQIAELSEKYPEKWQSNVMAEQLFSVIYDLNYYTYKEVNSNKAISLQTKVDDIIAKMDNNDWLYFLKQQKKVVDEQLTTFQRDISSNLSESIEKDLANLKIAQTVIDYRVENKINYDNSYLDKAIEEYKATSITLLNYADNIGRSQEMEKQSIEETQQRAKYMMDNQININLDGDEANANVHLLNSVTQLYTVLYIIIIVFLCCSIVSEEVNKGTIKQLLIKPYSRTKILLSKYIVCLLVILFAVLAVTLIQYIVGTITFGYTPFSEKVGLIYNYQLHELKLVSNFYYLFINLAMYLPIMLIIATLSFTISTIFTNTVLAAIIPFILIYRFL